MKARIGIAVGIAAVAITLAAVVPSLASPARPTAPATSSTAPAIGAVGTGSVPASSYGTARPSGGSQVRVLPGIPSIACPAVYAPCPPPVGVPGGANTVTVTGTGTVTSQPDEAVLGLGVRTQASDAADALKENATRMTAVMKALQDLGIKSDDITTTSVTLNPNYSNDGSSITSYVAENDISVTLHDLSLVGTAIDTAVAAGANVENGITFQMSDANSGLTDALKQAVADARSQAAALADAAGAKLGGVVSITEGGAQSPIPYAFGPEAGAATTPVNPGPVQLQVSVTVVWALQ
ncbi:MAG: SIMPL domain-containing protein [Actinomycetota bacterium]|nr:SIMPL domain-containing protein [Actinomycetota bacterium]